MTIVRFLAFFLVILSTYADNLLNSFEVSYKDNLKEEEITWQLKQKKNTIGKLESIGGKPILLSLTPIHIDKKTSLYELRYDAGMMGTKLLFHVERILILEKSESNVWKAHKDFLVKVSRLKGDKILDAENRKHLWKDGRITLDEIEDQPAETLRWTGNSLIKVK